MNQIGANFTINGKRQTKSFNYLFASQGVYDASGWDSAGKLNLFPNNDVSSAALAKPGDLHYFAMYNKVSTITLKF